MAVDVLLKPSSPAEDLACARKLGGYLAKTVGLSKDDLPGVLCTKFGEIGKAASEAEAVASETRACRLLENSKQMRVLLRDQQRDPDSHRQTDTQTTKHTLALGRLLGSNEHQQCTSTSCRDSFDLLSFQKEGKEEEKMKGKN